MRRRRLAAAAAVSALLVLGGAAVLTLRHISRNFSGLPGFWARLGPRIESVTVAGAPEELTREIEAYLSGEGGAAVSSRVAELGERFTCLRTVRVSRDWRGRSARVDVALRRALGAVRRRGRPIGFLDETGGVFASAPALYPEARLALDVEDADSSQLRALAGGLSVLGGAEDLPSPVERVRFRSPYEGWEVFLADGTRVLWGDFRWTREKLSRLQEALADARRSSLDEPAGASLGGQRSPFRDGDAIIADLRYFEDGRVLLRPVAGGRS